MKTFRKSLHRETQRLQISTPLPIPQVSKPTSASLPPQKVIRAIAPHSPNTPQELPFQKGDFFYVTADPATDSPWYEAHNPVTGARGLVPKILFEEFLKSPSVSVPPPFSPPSLTPQQQAQPTQPPEDTKDARLLRRRPPRFPRRARRRARRQGRRSHLGRRPVQPRVVRRQTHRQARPSRLDPSLFRRAP